jgi:myb proto-oncogene protein
MMSMMMKSIPNGDEVLRKGPWMPEEDEILVDYVRQFGARDWSSIRSKGLLPRTGKSCRLRWVNKLKPDLKRCFPPSLPISPTPLSYYSRKGNNKLKEKDQTSSLIAFLCLHKEIYHNYVVSLHLWHWGKIMSICHDVKLLYCLMRCIVLFINKTMYVE